MYHNGVSHLTVPSDLEGIEAIINWLAFVPKDRNSIVPILPITDPIERKVGFTPPASPYDPRWLVDGVETDVGGEKVSLAGFFDKGSWIETLAGWAKNVVVGRARLGGIPVGVLCVEPRTTELRIPADPATIESQEVVSQQAGLVWFPNSAFKTAQAIKDFNQEGIPLIIFANWRGFSGGVRDMFGEILKYGSYIVDALVAYKQPVLSYIPPHGELRGGSWVVVDPTINQEMMEMYAAESARGGVLEPDGTVEIKFKKEDCLKVMRRLDEHYAALSQQFEEEPDREAKAVLKTKMMEYEKQHYPLYHQVALEFANLHDTPGRMKAKEVINDMVPWETSREYFYWRLYRRVLEVHYAKQIRLASPSLGYAAAISKLYEWTSLSNSTSNQEATEKLLALQEEIVGRISQLSPRQEFLRNLVQDGNLAGLAELIHSLSSEQQTELKKLIG